MPELITDGPFPPGVLNTLPTGSGTAFPKGYSLSDAAKYILRLKSWNVTINIHYIIYLDGSLFYDDTLNVAFTIQTFAADESDLACKVGCYGNGVIEQPDLSAVFYELGVATASILDPGSVSESAGAYHPMVELRIVWGDNVPPMEVIARLESTSNETDATLTIGGVTVPIYVVENTLPEANDPELPPLPTSTYLTGSVIITPNPDYWGFGGVVNSSNGDALIPSKTEAEYYFQCPCGS